MAIDVLASGPHVSGEVSRRAVRSWARPGWEQLGAAVLASVDRMVTVMADRAVADRWEQPSVLPALSVGQLAAHLAQMVSGLAASLERDPPPATAVEVRDLIDVYGSAARLDPREGLEGRVARTIREWAAEGARRDRATLIADTRADAGRLPALLEGAAPERPVPSTVLPGLAMTLADFLRTRCVEFVVHVDDLATSAGLPVPEPDPAAAGIAIDVLIDMCRARAGDAETVRALARPDRARGDTLRAL